MSKIAEAAYGDAAAPYPALPGFKRPGTSQEAARAVYGRATNVREAIYRVIAASPAGLTADEAAAAVGRKPSYCRPRLSELVKAGRIAPSGLRRRNETGLSAAVWVVTP